jgi:hypothetical protein
MDGYRYGNLERFINHSKKNANCKPLVRLVNGEHRIGFFATKDLAAGVELFFDYGKDFIKKHGLKEMEDVSKERGGGSKKMRRASKGMKIVSKEMRDTLKGIGDFSSEENATIDDDGTMPAIVYSFPDDGEAEEYVEDPDDVRKPSRRPRRNVVKPKKYTR